MHSYFIQEKILYLMEHKDNKNPKLQISQQHTLKNIYIKIKKD